MQGRFLYAQGGYHDPQPQSLLRLTAGAIFIPKHRKDEQNGKTVSDGSGHCR
nr:MAG TPA: hypothetical protein [Caudoviricetes sp.]